MEQWTVSKSFDIPKFLVEGHLGVLKAIFIYHVLKVWFLNIILLGRLHLREAP